LTKHQRPGTRRAKKQKKAFKKVRQEQVMFLDSQKRKKTPKHLPFGWMFFRKKIEKRAL
jgi:hypothetical protein